MSPALSSRSRILSGSIPKEMLRFGTPLALGMGLQTTFNLVDAYVISRLSPDVAGPALGALGICDQLSAIGTIVSYGITTASTAMIARAHGRGDRAEVHRIAWQSVLAVGALSILFGFVSIAFAEPILSGLVGAKGKVAELGAAYLRVNSGGSFSIFFLLQLTAIQRALGSAKTPVLLLLLSNVLNLFFAALFVYGAGPAPPVFAWATPIAAALHVPRMELVGAAWATVLARSIVLVPVIILLIRRFDAFNGESRGGLDRRVLGPMWRIGWPSSAQFVARMTAMLITHSLVARAFTTPEDQSATTALGIVFRLETMALFVAMGWGSAAQTFVGQNLGADQLDRAKSSGYFAAAYNAVLMLLIAIAYHYEARSIIEFFDSAPQVVAVATSYVDIVSWSYFGLGAGVVLGSAINGAGATRTTLVADLGLVVGFQIPACTLAALLGAPTLERLWSAVAVTYGLSGVAYLLVFRLVRWAEASGLAHPSPQQT